MQIVAILLLSMVVAGPLLLALIGRMCGGRGRVGRASTDWRLSLRSALLHVLAFTLIFFIQELFLVLPKALVPGLHPVLFHNNHDWTGDNRIANLLQGTGALAILIVAIVCAWVQDRRPRPSLFLVWVMFQGVFQSLPQVVVGALFPPNDVGRAMAYLALTPVMKGVLALLALAGMAGAAVWLAPRFTAPGGSLLRIVTLPAFASLPLVLAYRVPGEIIQVAIVPLVVTMIGTAWVQAAGWRAPPAVPAQPVGAPRFAPLLIMLAMLLAFFQLILRPGVAFG